MTMYSELAAWWPLLSHPDEYLEEAGIYARHLLETGDGPAETLLELGSGGGNNASHLKAHFRMTLVDLSFDMLAVSRALNPDCEHHLGDMRTVRLDREFDRVFLHDAVVYMATLDDLRLAMDTAFVHCRPGGVVVVAPDFVRETFRPITDHGGSDRGGRGLRYLEWCWDPDPADSTYVVDYALMLRERDGSVRVEHDRHVEGLFSRAEWIETLTAAGFEASAVSVQHAETDPYSGDLFIGVRPGASASGAAR